jgi:hypothetical protein
MGVRAWQDQPEELRRPRGRRRAWPRVSLGRLVLVVLIGLGSWAALAWPRVRDVETGASAGYPDLQPRQYTIAEGKLLKTVERAVRGLRGWQWIGSGSGPIGGEVRCLVTLPVVGLKYDVIVRTTRSGNKTQLRVRSRSQALPWDFGQNARNIRKLLAAIEKES